MVSQEEYTSAFRAGCKDGNSEFFPKKDSLFCCYDFKRRGKRCATSTKTTNKKRAATIAALRLSEAVGGIGLWDGRSHPLRVSRIAFLNWVESATLAISS